MSQVQAGWRSCPNCQGMHFAGVPDFEGVCPAGGQHSQTNSFAYTMDFDSDPAENVQTGWAACPKCQGLHFAGFPNFKGVCPAGGQHDQTNSFAYSMLHDLPPTQNVQSEFRSCTKCQGLFYGPFSGQCPTGGAHDPQGSFNYGMRLESEARSVVDFDFNPIVFDNGVPVGGSSHLTLRQDGSVTFFGHFHDSGATEYNVSLVWAVKDSQNEVYTFQHSGHVSGTFEPGSRDDDWRIDSRDDRIANNWAHLATGSSASAKADVNIDLANLTNTLIGTLGTVLGVVAIVVA